MKLVCRMRYSCHDTTVVFREKRRELMMLQQLASPGAIRNIEELAKMQAQQHSEAAPAVDVKTPQILSSHVEPPKSEAGASDEKEKVLIKVQDKSGNSQSIRIYAVSKCSSPHIIEFWYWG